MVVLVRPFVLVPTVVGAAAIAAAYWTAQAPRGILIDLLLLAGLAGVAGISLSRSGATWARRIVWISSGALLLTAAASVAWMPPWIAFVALGFVGCVCRRRPPVGRTAARAIGLVALGAFANVYVLGALARHTPFSADPAAYRALELRAHTLFADVPLHDVWVVDLPGGGEGRVLRDLTGLPTGRADVVGAMLSGTLLGTRLGVGRVLGWDAEAAADPDQSFAGRLTPADHIRCGGTCTGERSGPFGMRTLYAFERENTREVQNRTVHTLLTMALAPTEAGYRLHIGVYVRPIGRFTAAYMATVDPFRRLVLYPTGFRTLQRRWRAAWPAGE